MDFQEGTRAGIPHLRRTFWLQKSMDALRPKEGWKRDRHEAIHKDNGYSSEPPVAADEQTANLVGSLLEGQDDKPTKDKLHGFCVDIDMPCALIESSPGRYHLYVEKAIPWGKYLEVLKALADAGIIERGYYGASRERKASFLRKATYDKFFNGGKDRMDVVTQATIDLMKELEESRF